jgi:hypothetical protein
MLITEYVNVKWNSKIKKHYTDIGYTFTKMKDEFTVYVGDLTPGSNILVDVQCDYCGAIYKKRWCNYIKENRLSIIHKDSCDVCKSIKAKESVCQTYGVENVFQLDDVKNKLSQTNIEKYGVANPFQSDEIKRKITETNIRKYGTKSAMQNKAVLKRAQNTCMQKYGVSSYLELVDSSGANNANWKGGVARIRSERFTIEYIKWRKDVYKRDGYTCQCCGQHGSNNLNAHHIMNWRDNPNLRFNLDNGITLCESCHYLFHHLYGKRFNNRDQLITFIDIYGKKVC